MMKIATRGALLLLTCAESVMLAGCANTIGPGIISDYYRSVGASNGTSRQTHPQIAYTSALQQKALIENYLRVGYHIIGVCGFNRADALAQGANPIEKQILAQAKQVKADIAVYYTAPAGSEIVNAPVVAGFSEGGLSTTRTNETYSIPGSSDTINGTGASTTWTPGQTYYTMMPTSVERTGHYIVFLAH
jgi:hypothetical protein